MICLKWSARRDLSIYAILDFNCSMHHIIIISTATIMTIKREPKPNKMLFSSIQHLTMPCYLYCHANCASFIMAWLFACRILIHMRVHFIYVGPCLFGSSSNRRWAGDISRNPGALPRSFSRFNWAARQALPHACIHTVPIASILFLHHWVAIALNWIPSIA